MNKANVIGKRWVHKYAIVANGEPTRDLLEVECTEAEYKDIANNPPPAKDGYEWVSSVERNLYDTPSGDLDDGYYVERTIRDIKLPGMNIVSFEATIDAEAGLKKTDQDLITPDQFGEIWSVKERQTLEMDVPSLVEKIDIQTINSINTNIIEG